MRDLILQASRQKVGAPQRLSASLLQELAWRRFEEAVARYFTMTGLRAELGPGFADHGIDITLYRYGATVPCAIVQCKSGQQEVSLSQVRETVAAVPTVAPSAREVYVVAAGSCKSSAWRLARQSQFPITLWTGELFSERVNALPPAQLQLWLQQAFDGDYHTPTCNRCRQAMSAAFAADLGPAWLCPVPECRAKLTMRKQDQRIVYDEVRRRSGNAPKIPSPATAAAPAGGPPAASAPAPFYPWMESPRPPRWLRPLFAAAAVLAVSLWMIHGLLPPKARVAAPRVAASAPAAPSPQSPPLKPRAPVSSPPALPVRTAPADPVPTPPPVAAPLPLLQYHRPKHLFHLAIERRVIATPAQIEQAARIAKAALERYQPDRRPPYLAVEIGLSRAERLANYLVFDVAHGSVAGDEFFIARPQPNRTSAMLHRYECVFVRAGAP